eukprot:INCI5105.6.p1 GENE.INCI5105.6~~INCI5105.6.p1  ORF type:complete len:361 (-),score=68.73 INCI5105.6:36-1118(-)
MGEEDGGRTGGETPDPAKKEEVSGALLLGNAMPKAAAQGEAQGIHTVGAAINRPLQGTLHDEASTQGTAVSAASTQSTDSAEVDSEPATPQDEASTQETTLSAASTQFMTLNRESDPPEDEASAQHTAVSAESTQSTDSTASPRSFAALSTINEAQVPACVVEATPVANGVDASRSAGGTVAVVAVPVADAVTLASTPGPSTPIKQPSKRRLTLSPVGSITRNGDGEQIPAGGGRALSDSGADCAKKARRNGPDTVAGESTHSFSDSEEVRSGDDIDIEGEDSITDDEEGEVATDVGVSADSEAKPNSVDGGTPLIVGVQPRSMRTIVVYFNSPSGEFEAPPVTVKVEKQRVCVCVCARV